MTDVHQDNARKQLKEAKKQALLAHAAYEFFTQTENGKELYEELEFQSGANFCAFTAKDNFNAYSAAYRDGMRATFLIVQNLIKHHEKNHE